MATLVEELGSEMNENKRLADKVRKQLEALGLEL
jgi:hypothetical protein